MTILNHFPYLLHGGDYNPEQWRNRGEIILEDFRLMKKAGCNTLTIGVFSWSDLEPEEGRCTFEWLDEIMEQCAKNRMNVLLATPSAARPAWLHRKYPETARVSRSGQREPWGRRANHCWSSPIFRRLLAERIGMLARRYSDAPALAGWHVGNEPSGECCCENCLAGFHRFLEEKYQTVERLNECWWSSHWGHRFSTFRDVNPLDDSVDSAVLEFRRYNTLQIADFLRFEIGELRKLSRAPVTTNMMGFYPYLDYWKIASECDFISDDSYPTWYCGETEERAAELCMTHDMHYAMKQKPFLILECCPGVPNYKPYSRMRRPGEFEREMLLALGHGADGTMYFQWRKSRGGCEKIHGAVVGHDGGTETLVFRRVAGYGQRLLRLAEICGSTREASVGLVFDWESGWALSATLGFGSQWGDARKQRLLETVKAHYRAFWKLNIPVDVISSECNFKNYRLLILPMLFMLKSGVAERLRTFTENGGTIVMTYLSACVDEHNLCFEGGNPGGRDLRELFGVWSEDIDVFDPPTIQTLRYRDEDGTESEFRVERRCEYCHAEGAEVLAVYGRDFFAGTPALTRRRCGRGEALYLAADTGDEFLEFLYRRIAKRCGVERLWPQLPPEVKISRRSGKESDYYFLVNLTSRPVDVTLPAPLEELWNGAGIVNHIRLPENGGTVLRSRRMIKQSGKANK